MTAESLRRPGQTATPPLIAARTTRTIIQGTSVPPPRRLTAGSSLVGLPPTPDSAVTPSAWRMIQSSTSSLHKASSIATSTLLASLLNKELATPMMGCLTSGSTSLKKSAVPKTLCFFSTLRTMACDYDEPCDIPDFEDPSTLSASTCGACKVPITEFLQQIAQKEDDDGFDVGAYFSFLCECPGLRLGEDMDYCAFKHLPATCMDFVAQMSFNPEDSLSYDEFRTQFEDGIGYMQDQAGCA
mmetsp:Transcript_14578/g.29901  ORF Transcript_14578/g.29901 Transcript_14578/m.29901 type:complete len:242 (-) Transcript_14578:150-875(-)